MSAFEQAQEAAQYRRLRPPSPLQIAWIVVLLTFGGIGLWLSLSPLPPAPPTPAAAVATSVIGPENLAEISLPPGDEEEAAAETAADRAMTDGAIGETAAPAPAIAKTMVTLTPAPDPAITETSTFGPLPKVAGEREPWQVYARPFEAASARPRIAIVIAGLGLSKSTTETAVTTLPGAVTLAFSPYGSDLQARVDNARNHGHEVLLQIPMEPQDYPKNDPGPQTLLTSLPMADNLDRLHWAMARFAGYVGLINEMGSRYTASEEHMTATLNDVKARGLMFMDARSSQYSVAAKLSRTLRVPRVLNNRYIDAPLSEDSIRSRLTEMESLARTYGAAAGIGYAYPLTMRVVAQWAAGLSERGFDLAPVSAVANRQPVR